MVVKLSIPSAVSTFVSLAHADALATEPDTPSYCQAPTTEPSGWMIVMWPSPPAAAAERDWATAGIRTWVPSFSPEYCVERSVTTGSDELAQ